MIEELENTIPLNTKFFRSDINDNTLLKILWEAVYPDKKFRIDSKQFNHLKLIVLKLYDCHNSGFDYIRFSRHNSDYNLDNEENKLKLSFRVLVHIVDKLYEHGYIKMHLGFYDNTKGTGKVSRMRATDKLIEVIESVEEAIFEIESDDNIDGNNDVIVLKNFEKEIVTYEETDLTSIYRAVLVSYNNLIAKSNISLNSNTYLKVNYDKKFVKRVFNDSSFSLCGRFYGGWWQNIKSKYRPHIFIDDKETIKIDYTALHLILAYTLKDVDYINEIGDDPYDINGIEYCEGLRNLLKLTLLICINSSNKKEAIRVLNMKANHGDTIRHPKYSMSEIIDICEDKHRDISEYFYSGGGKLFQYNDSMIAHNIIKHFTEKNILVLCIHDSFICQKEYETELNDCMKESIKNTYGIDINLKFK